MIKRGNTKGLSTIVATLIIILLVLVAVGIIWVVVRNVIQQGSEQVSLGKFTLDLKIEQVQIISDTQLNVKVKRNSGAGEFVGLKIIIEDSNENEIIDLNTSLNELEERTFNINLVSVNASNLQKISVAPIFKLESGREIIGDVKDEYLISSAGICSPVCNGRQCGSDGCGGVCGTCQSGQNCLTNGTCSVTQCTDTCSSLGFSCGTINICGLSTNCGSCGLGQTCQTNGTCLATPCTDTCTSLGYTCGTRTVCGASVNCGTCASGSTCQTNGTCITNPPTCTDTCSSLGFSCGTRTVCGASVNCGSCASGSSCQTNGTCITNPPTCTDTCSSLGYACGTRTVCGASVNCGTCASGSTCQTNGTCITNPPTTSWDTYASGSRNAYGITTDGIYFWITDHGQAEVYRFYFNGTYTGFHFDTEASGANYPSAMSADGSSLLMVAYYDNMVYRYNMDGTFTGLNWSYGQYFGNAWGMTQNGTHLWTLSSFRVDTYLMDGTHLNYFSTESTDNVNGLDLTHDNINFWITDTTDDEIYKYYINGTYTGLHIDTAVNGNEDPYGIVRYGTRLYVTDPIDDEIYIYDLF